MTMAILADTSAVGAVNRSLRLVACLQLFHTPLFGGIVSFSKGQPSRGQRGDRGKPATRKHPSIVHGGVELANRRPPQPRSDCRSGLPDEICVAARDWCARVKRWHGSIPV